MSFYADVDTQTRERKALEPDSYGTGKQSGLKILSYFGEKAEKNRGYPRHGFLVAATRPGREQLKKYAEKASNGNGKAGETPEFVTEPDYEGTAFMHVTLNPIWLHPEPIALAFTEASRNKDGIIQKDHEAAALKSGDVTEESLQTCREYFQKIAKDKVIAANTPAEKLEEEFNNQYRKELQQVSINVGQFFTLQDWSNGGDKTKRNLNLEMLALVNTEFSGTVEASNFGNGGSEVKSIYSCNIQR